VVSGLKRKNEENVRAYELTSTQ